MTNALYTQHTGLFDLFFRDYIRDEVYSPLPDKVHYPTDIYEDAIGLSIDIVAIGAQKDDVSILTEDGNTLKVTYKNTSKPMDENVKHWHSRNITRKDFEFGWTIPTKFNLTKISAEYEGGVIKFRIPFSEASKPKEIKLG